MLVTIAELAHLRGWEYNRTHRAVIKGSVPGARRVGGRWLVEIPDSTTAAVAVPAEVNRLQQLTADLERDPLPSRLAHPSACGPVVA